MRIDQITPELVELAPRVLQPGRLYISEKYQAAVHLCCCGCGEKVVTPLSPAEWRIKLQRGRATLHPSIGNWSMVCQSHYWIRENRVIWSGRLSERQIQAVFERDQRDLQAMYRGTQGTTAEQPAIAGPSPSSQDRGNNGWHAWLKALWRWLTR